MIALENPVPSSLPASERRAAGATIFEVVAVIEKTTVRAGAAPLQMQSGEHSALIDGSQIQSTLQGRNLNGNRQSTPNLTLDGISMMDTGGGTGPYYEPNIDAIAEIKALLTNYQANMSEPRGGAITEFHRKRDKLSFWSEEFMKRRGLYQLCFETYNTLNHARFTTLDNNASFNAQGNHVNTIFGQYNEAASGRHIALAGKINFQR
jgi:hypothetical protein